MLSSEKSTTFNDILLKISAYPIFRLALILVSPGKHPERFAATFLAVRPEFSSKSIQIQDFCDFDG